MNLPTKSKSLCALSKNDIDIQNRNFVYEITGLFYQLYIRIAIAIIKVSCESINDQHFQSTNFVCNTMGILFLCEKISFMLMADVFSHVFKLQTLNGFSSQFCWCIIPRDHFYLSSSPLTSSAQLAKTTMSRLVK